MSKFNRLDDVLLEYEKLKKNRFTPKGKEDILIKKEYFSKKHINYKQVVIKNIGNCDKKRLQNSLKYILTHSVDNQFENQKGEKIFLNEVLDDWHKDFSNKKNSKEGLHLVFSINEDFNQKNIKALELATKETLEKNFFAYKYVLVKHIHQNNPHFHVLINKNNIFTGKKLHFETADHCRNFFNKMRDDFAMSLNYYNPNFHYINRYKYDKDLEMEIIQKKSLQTKGLQTTFIYDTTQKNLIDEANFIYEKLKQNKNQINFLELGNKKISQKIKNNIENKIPINRLKKYFDDNIKNMKLIKMQNDDLISKYNAIQKLVKDIKYHQVQSQKIEDNFVALLDKKNLIQLFQKNKKSLSLKRLNILNKLIKEIDQKEDYIVKQTMKQTETTSIRIRVFDKKTSGFKIVKMLKECEHNKNKLETMKQDVITKDYLALQNKNIEYLTDSLVDRFQNNQTKIKEFHLKTITLEKDIKDNQDKPFNDKKKLYKDYQNVLKGIVYYVKENRHIQYHYPKKIIQDKEIQNLSNQTYQQIQKLEKIKETKRLNQKEDREL